MAALTLSKRVNYMGQLKPVSLKIYPFSTFPKLENDNFYTNVMNKHGLKLFLLPNQIELCLKSKRI